MRSPTFLAVPSLAAAVAVALTLPGRTPPPAAPHAAQAEAEEEAPVTHPPSWQSVETLIRDQRYRAALAEVNRLLEDATRRGDAAEVTRALLEGARLEMGLGGFERAVRYLRTHPWPEAPMLRAQLELAYAHTLSTYLGAYSWEIGRREEVVSTEEPDISRWTRRQILAEVHGAFARLWRQRDALDARPLTALAEALEPNDYPTRIRGTVRDALTYLWADVLADTSLWLPGQSRRVYTLDLARLLAGVPEGLPAERLADPSVHPLLRLAAILGDLERWHAARGEGEAALEAFRRRLELLHQAMEREEDRRAIREALAARLARTDRGLPWWSWVQATLAEMVRVEDAPDALVRARALALEGARANPGTPGARRCRAIVAAIEAPHFFLESMTADGPDRRSLRVTHRNLSRLHLRAWRLDLHEFVTRPERWSLGPDWRDGRQILGRAPDAAWEAELPPTPDYRDHVTYLTPRLRKPGLWVVAAAADRSFDASRGEVQLVSILVGDPVLLVRRDGDRVEAEVRSGRTGEPISGATVWLYRRDYRNGHRWISTAISDREGRVTFRLPARRSCFLLARARGEYALFPGDLERSRPADTGRTGALVFTDRAVYRPGQTLLFKVIAYEGDAASGRFAVSPGREVTVTLRDANGEAVATRTLATDRFGSADGEIVIPRGRLLGAWWLECRPEGSASIRVEEYRRPTFTVEIPPPAAPLRLGREATLEGEARYYFGLPVVDGAVAWRVERVPEWPRWWWWRPGPQRPEVVAAGDARTDAEGRFTVRFVPEADERESAAGVTYRFRLVAEVTDPGGETRSGERAFRLGFVAVEATVVDAPGFLRPASRAGIAVRRSTLDGTPAPGEGRWRLVRLEQPERTPLPADVPVRPPPGEPEDAYHTPGDRLRPRWRGVVAPARILSTWSEGEEVARGTVHHGPDGTGTIVLPALEPGAYRLLYETDDPYGATARARRELVVTRAMTCPVRVPLVLELERDTVPVGGTARILVHSGLPDQEMVLEVFRSGRRIERRVLRAGAGPVVITRRVTAEDRGGLGIRLTALRDHQLMRLERRLRVPWDDRRLELELASFRDRVRPGARETFSVTVRGADGKAVGEGVAQLLALMYDASLDLFAPYAPPDPLGLYPDRTATGRLACALGGAGPFWKEGSAAVLPRPPSFHEDSVRALDRYGIGGMGRYGPGRVLMAAAPVVRKKEGLGQAVAVVGREAEAKGESQAAPAGEKAAPVELRADFAETALWEPTLLTGADGSVTVSYQVPDSVTEWNLWMVAVTRDLRAGRLHATTRSVKELMVRPYLPRFLREGDRATIRIEVNDAGDVPLEGAVDLDIVDPESGESLLGAFGLSPETAHGLPFRVEPGRSATLEVPVVAPPRPGLVAFKVVARSGDLSDGELRPLPVLPGRYHLVRSRFATLRDDDRRVLELPGMADTSDPTRVNEALVVTVDAQLLTTVLRALPYLVRYPYECTEQTLNRFLSAGIVSSVFRSHPELAALARRLAARRDTRLERWDRPDPNRVMLLEETPWLVEARGGGEEPGRLLRLLDPDVADAQRREALTKLEKAQLPSGAFPWWPGGPPSPYMTLYILDGLARAVEHGIPVPRRMVQRAWRYVADDWLDDLVTRAEREDCCWEMVTYLGYVLSCYPDEEWTGGAFSHRDRERMLALSWKRWREHPPRLKGYLALTLERMGRHDDALRVFESVMDSARSDPDLGVYWQPEERSWLWYNDTTEGHALALRVLAELAPDDPRRDGLVQWLLLDKKLGHWKSTRATAEVIYALVTYMEREGLLGATQTVEVSAGPRSATFRFEPDEPVTRARLAVDGPEIVPREMSRIEVTSHGKGFAFATVTWRFSTEREPEAGPGTLFALERRLYRRVRRGDEWVLEPLAEGARVEVGDEVEVELTLRARHRAEYVHLRDPRPAGFEPAVLTSGWEAIGGLSVYREVRDSGADFFIERLPAGEYRLRHRLRAAVAGRFRVAPATLQCMYAPEHTAHSAGTVVEVEPGR